MLARISKLFSVRVVSAAFQAVTLLFVARALGPSAFGMFAALLAFGGVAANVLGLGVRAQAMRILASRRPNAKAATLSVVRLISALMSAALTYAVGRVWFDLESWTTVAASLYVASDAIAIFVQNLLLGFKKFGRANAAIVIRSVGPFLAVLVAVGIQEGAVAAFAMGSFVASLCGVALLWRELAGFDRLAPVLRESRSYWAATSLVSLYQLDVTILAAVAPGLAGNFAGAQRVTNPLNLAVVSVLAIVTPELSSARTPSSRRQLFGSTRRAIALIGVATAASSPLAYVLGPRLLGPEYVDAAWLFVALFIVLAINALTQVYTASFYAVGKARDLAVLRLICVPIYLVGVVLGAYWFGEPGLGVSLVLGRALELLAMHRWHRRTIERG